MKELKFYNPLSMSNDCEAIEYQDIIDEALAKDDVDLAKYADDYHGDSYYKKLRSCKIQTEVIDGVLYGVTVCEVADSWNDADTAQMKEYLAGQYSDGWGESFEQQELCEYEEEYTETYEDEDGEEYEETYTEPCGVYCSFWSSSPKWFIKTEKEIKQNKRKDESVCTPTKD